MAMSKGLTKILYMVVKDGDTAEMEKNDVPSFWYTRSVLQSTLQLIGCKSRHAFKISKRVFEMVREGTSLEKLSECFEVSQKDVQVYNHDESCLNADVYSGQSRANHLALDEDKSKSKPFELYKRRTTVVVQRNVFLDVVCEALSEYKYVGPNQRADLVIACRIRERKESVTVLLCGTSGCGKSTLSALLGSRLGITTIVSTDSIRHMMRSFVNEKQNPLLWSSTYHAGEHLDPVAVAEANAKRKAKKLTGVSTSSLAKNTTPNNFVTENSVVSFASGDLISGKQMAVKGFKAQSEMVIDSLDRLITAWEERKESVVVEGVHLSLNFAMSLMKKHHSIIPFMIYISNEDKHLERFAVRAKYMTLDPAKNKYVKYIRNIRAIQEYLCNRADKHLVPKINNTNVDKSVAVIHATVFSCLRRRVMGEQLYDPLTNTVEIVHEEYRNHRTAYSLSSKGMFQLIQRHGSSRQLMALLNNDGSVAKAWPVIGIDDTNNPGPGNTFRNEIGSPMYGPLQIGKTEPINLQFGYFGISSWPTNMGGTSRGSSVDGSRGDTTENSRSHSSGCSSPHAPSKELKEELSVHGSDDEEEVDDHPEVDSDEDLIDREKNLQEELEGSVDEEYTKSDEEYDDLAMQDFPTGRMSDDDQEFFYKMQLNAVLSNRKGRREDKYLQNLDRFLRTKHDPLAESLLCSFTSPMKQRAERSSAAPHPMACNFRKRSQSIPSFGKHGALINVPNQ